MNVRLGILFSTALVGAGCLPITNQLGYPARIPAGGPPTYVTASDLNGDGKIDLVISRSDLETTGAGAVTDANQTRVTEGALAVMLGHGDGTFSPSFNTAGVSGSVSYAWVADYNGDGRPDIAVTGLAGAGFVSVLLGKGDGTFQAPISFIVGGSVTSVKSADLNGDGKLDLVVLDKRPNGGVEGGKIAVLMGHGDGTFDAAISRAVGRTPESFALGDWNGDKRVDIAIADTRAMSVIFWMGNGDGSFQEGPRLRTEFAPVGVSGPDINKDGRLDLSVAGIQGVMIYLGNGDGSFNHAADYFVDATRSGFYADFDHDGNLDFVTARRLFRGDGTGHFTVSALPANQFDDSSVIATDVNNDGWMDVVGADQAHSRLDVYLNQGGAAPLHAAR